MMVLIAVRHATPEAAGALYLDFKNPGHMFRCSSGTSTAAAATPDSVSVVLLLLVRTNRASLERLERPQVRF